MGKVQARLGNELTLYVRHLAWLGATPRPAAGTPAAEKFDLSKAKSRLEQMKASDIVPDLPPLSGPHLFQWLTEMGLAGSNGMGAVPLSWCEITAWVERTGVDLAPWESRMLRAASAAYVTESRHAEDDTAPPPYFSGKVSQAEIKREIDLLDDLLG